jgi:hypothetical protein
MTGQYEEGYFPAPTPEEEAIDQRFPERVGEVSDRPPLAEIKVRAKDDKSSDGDTEEEVTEKGLGAHRLKKGMVISGHTLLEPMGGGKSLDIWRASHPKHGNTFVKVISDITFPSVGMKHTDPEAFASVERVFVNFEGLHQMVLADLQEKSQGDGALVVPLEMGRTAEGKIFKISPLLTDESFDESSGKATKRSKESASPALSLSSKSVKCNKWSADHKVRFIRSALLALWQLHGRGYVHGDIKLANLLVVNSPNGPLARLIDFDNCYPSGAPLDSSLIGGDETYFSPERADYYEGDLDDPSILTIASDLFSLALVFHQAFSEKQELPKWSIAGGSASDSSSAGGIPTFSNLGTGNPGLENLLRDCLKKDPHYRPSTRSLLASSGVYISKE